MPIGQWIADHAGPLAQLDDIFAEYEQAQLIAARAEINRQRSPDGQPSADGKPRSIMTHTAETFDVVAGVDIAPGTAVLLNRTLHIDGIRCRLGCVNAARTDRDASEFRLA